MSDLKVVQRNVDGKPSWKIILDLVGVTQQYASMIMVFVISEIFKELDEQHISTSSHLIRSRNHGQIDRLFSPQMPPVKVKNGSGAMLCLAHLTCFDVEQRLYM